VTESSRRVSAPSPSSSGPGGPGGSDASLGELVSDATERMSSLVRSEVELAKAEITQSVKKGGLGAGLLGGAGFFGVFAFLFVSLAAAWGIAEFLPDWAAFLIVGAVYGLLAAILALRGKKSLSSVGPPERTIQAAKDDLALAKNPTGGTTRNPALPQR
jgi:hypothetical protein